ncbi:uncharacterized protein LOC127289987 [Leptopilina boulardi]|uniref:uncharacterized protein LOC127289987 n=1 Tax=Leptopilina boulardi TaxID=63433 RepID=UPI0021F5E6C1|nr:uncharacterized protein LOC127289987 [Leptopilina boulardi]
MGSSVNSSEYGFRNPQKLSTLEECRRICMDNEPPRYCYYHFAIEYYHTMGSPCFPCRQNGTDLLLNKPNCQCIEADGKKRTILSINRLLPGPSIQLCERDILIVDVENKAEGLEMSMHWHGQLLNGYQYYDGVPMVTQCPILAGSTFRYQFPVINPGTFFYHAHVSTQRMDGQFGSLIVRQTSSQDPHWSEYDEDLPTHIIIIHDWFHYLSSEEHPTISEDALLPPNNILINGRGRFQDSDGKVTNATLETFYVEPGKRYRFRLINSISLRCTAMFTIEEHNVTVIAQDSIPVSPEPVTSLHSAGGERVDFILTANRKPGSYWIQVRGLNDCAEKQNQQLAILSYSGASKTPQSTMPTYKNYLPEGKVHNPKDGKCDELRSNAICVTQLKSTYLLDKKLTKGEPDQRFIFPLDVHAFDYGEKNPYYSTNEFYKKSPYPTYPRSAIASIDGILNVVPSELLITSNKYSKITCNRKHISTNQCPDPCYCTHLVDIKKDAIVEIILYDKAGIEGVLHPFHLHGYKFTVLKIGQERTQNLTLRDVNSILNEHKSILSSTGYSRHTPMKDTVIVSTAGYVILRFIADNPGFWSFHCHIDWHMLEGMNMVLHVGNREDLPPIPKNFHTCGSWLPAM